MFQPWRIKLLEAQQAARNGHLEEATRLLSDNELREFLPAKRLLSDVAARIVERAQTRAQQGETSAGWHDLEAGADLGADPRRVALVREEFVRRALAEAGGYLAAGDPQAALARLAELERRQALPHEARQLRQGAQRLAAAQGFVRRGQFAEAQTELTIAGKLLPELDCFQRACEETRVKGDEHRRLARQLHEALLKSAWTEALAAAQAILKLAPDDRVAREALRRAWGAAGNEPPVGAPPQRRMAANPRRRATLFHEQPSMNAAGDSPSAGDRTSDRFLLWVDAVGGYLVCRGDEVTIGQPVPGSAVDVPLLADLSRQHAKIRRDGEGYLLIPVRETRLSGNRLAGPMPLTDGAQVELGPGVRLGFRQPHALSTSARLEFVSRHRTQPSADGVLLMADVLVLGPGSMCHVVCPEWTQEVVIYRQADELFCRTPGRFTVDGVEFEGQAPLTSSSSVAGTDFSFSLETL